MRRISLRLLTAVLAVVIATPLLAQQGRRGGMGFGGGGAMVLLTNKGVHEELKLSDEQAGKLKNAATELREKHKDELAKAREDKDREKSMKIAQEMNADFHKTVTEVLKPEQVKRLHQIEVQVAGVDAFRIERVQKAMKLTDKQQEKVKELEEEVQKARQEAFQGAAGDREKMQEAMKKLNDKSKEALEKVASQLSEEQKSTWKELTGAHFDYKPEQRRRPQ